MGWGTNGKGYDCLQREKSELVQIKMSSENGVL